ncbi:MAG: hypothetical protein RLY14_1647 [Planctomycetota bacterium]
MHTNFPPNCDLWVSLRNYVKRISPMNVNFATVAWFLMLSIAAVLIQTSETQGQTTPLLSWDGKLDLMIVDGSCRLGRASLIESESNTTASTLMHLGNHLNNSKSNKGRRIEKLELEGAMVDPSFLNAPRKASKLYWDISSQKSGITVEFFIDRQQKTRVAVFSSNTDVAISPKRQQGLAEVWWWGGLSLGPSLAEATVAPDNIAFTVLNATAFGTGAIDGAGAVCDGAYTPYTGYNLYDLSVTSPAFGLNGAWAGSAEIVPGLNAGKTYIDFRQYPKGSKETFYTLVDGYADVAGLLNVTWMDFNTHEILFYTAGTCAGEGGGELTGKSKVAWTD